MRGERFYAKSRLLNVLLLVLGYFHAGCRLSAGTHCLHRAAFESNLGREQLSWMDNIAPISLRPVILTVLLVKADAEGRPTL